MKRLLLSIIIFKLIFLKSVFANDTLKVMHYNLLYYDKNIYDCTGTTNNVNDKDEYLKTITNYYTPDIFTVNEMNGSVTSVNRLLNNVFINNGLEHYKRANNTGSFIINMLYYNSKKLELKSQGFINTSPRISDVYTLFYKSSELINGDTIFLTCIVTHLKAGNTSSDEADRGTSGQQIMNYIINNNIQGNVMLMGDLNVYTSTETAFQSFLTTTSTGVGFYDPVNAVGNWHNNQNFSNYHTQSTHVYGENPCFSSGGMDDRFDFVLTSLPIIQGSLGAKYVPSSYWAMGQDGNRLDKSLINPENKSLPSNIINALYNMSDHLPVVLKLSINANPIGVGAIFENRKPVVKTSNPVYDFVDIWSDSEKPENIRIRLFSTHGTSLKNENITLYPGQKQAIPMHNIPPGFYLITIDGNDFRQVIKVVKH